jgi:release factor glutamine methyltransferase
MPGYGLPVSDHTGFGPLQIGFDARVLRPREWTTAQSDWAADLLPRLPVGPVLELCAGAGQIGLLAVLHSTRRLVCVDADETACHFTRANADGARMADRVEVRHARLEEALGPEEAFPLIIADPPWVPRLDTGRFPEDPITAIDGGDDGLDVARSCLRVIQDHLAPGGSAILQLGNADQVAALGREQTSSEGLQFVETREHARGVLVQIDRRPAREV